MEKSDQYLILNTKPTVSQKRKEHIQEKQSQIIDSQKKVKFSTLKYELNELFDKKRVFDEPLIDYDAIEIGEAPLKYYNNAAFLNMGRPNPKDYTTSQWKHFRELTFNK